MTNFSTNIDQLGLTKNGALSAEAISYEGLGKRLFDLVAVLLAMPVLLPLIGILAALVRLDGGPAFFAQERIGRGGRRFRCYKLRTMHVDAEEQLARLCAENPEIAEEWEVHQKLQHDPRVTWIGRILRRTSLDELPQFFNVLLGSMSLVGPRPFTVEQEGIYRNAMGMAYFRMRPGITGPWQVMGRSTTTFVARVRFDERYYVGMSLMNDLWLCMKTFGVVLRRTGC